MKVILFEFIDEAKHYLDKFGRDYLLTHDTLIVSLHPKVRAFLKENGIESTDTVGYLDNASQQQIVLKTEELTNLILRDIRLMDQFGIEKGYSEACIYHLRFYINHFLWILEILRGINRKHRIQELSCCVVPDSSAMYADNVYIQNEERFLGLLAGEFCAKNKIKFNPEFLKAHKAGFLSSLAAALVRKLAKLIAQAEYLFFRSRCRGWKKAVIVPALSYNLKDIVKEIKASSPGMKCVMVWEGGASLKQELFKIYLICSNFIQKLKRQNILDAVLCVDLLKDDRKGKDSRLELYVSALEKISLRMKHELGEYLTAHQVSFSDYLEQKYYRGLLPEMLSLYHSTIFLEKVFRMLKQKLLVSMYSVGIYYMMGELSNYTDFPSIIISHGTHVPPNNEFEKIENFRLSSSVITNTYRYVAVQTPWVDKFLDYYKDSRPRILSGPLIYSKRNGVYGRNKCVEFTDILKNHKIIVHASTQKARHGMRFFIEETLDEYISTLGDLIDAVNYTDNAFLAIRPHPACDISEKEFLALLPKSEKVKILSEGPFKLALSIADLLVSYSSTCIEEALQSKVPVVLFDKWNRYNHFNIDETKGIGDIKRQPAYYVTSAQTLKECLPVLLKIMADRPLVDSDLTEYAYPAEFRSNFDNFINKNLKEDLI